MVELMLARKEQLLNRRPRGACGPPAYGDVYKADVREWREGLFCTILERPIFSSKFELLRKMSASGAIFIETCLEVQ